LAVAIAVVAVILTIAVRFWPHIRWRLSAQGRAMANITATPVHDMPAMSPPADWVATQVGALQLSLPIAVAESMQLLEDNAWHFEHGDIVIATTPTFDTRQFRVQVQMMDLATRGPDAEVKSVIDIKRDVYTAQSSDFRWWMNRSELRRHKWLMAMSQVSRPFPQTTIEATRNRDIEGLLTYHSTYGSFDWYTRDGDNGGLIVFKAAEGKTLNLDFVRTVCQHAHLRPVVSEVAEVEASADPPSPALPAEGREPDQI
jgi:hypothetical protein